ncbi:peptide chain release factor aRF-1 [Nanoarchaeota archaeon]
MKISELQRFELKKFIKGLENFRGRHTELVSVLIPSGYDMNKIIQHLAQEQGTATNIKSTSTRKNVIDALEKMIQHLRVVGPTPPNGLVVYSGNVAEQEGKQDFKVWSIEPPIPLKTRIYRCDKEFVLEPLREMVEIKESYGLVVLDRRDATIALLKGKSIVPLAKTHSEVPGKFKAGGQSAARFARNRELAIKDHYKKIADHIKDQFFHLKELKGIIIGGPGVTVSDFMNKGYITGDLQAKIIGTKDLSYTDDFGLQELLEKSEDLLANEAVAEEKKIMQKFLEMLAKDMGKVTYGFDHVKKALEMGAVEVLLLSESLEDQQIEQLEEIALGLGTEVKIISTETREGVQLKDIGKVAAILRYEADI